MKIRLNSNANLVINCNILNLKIRIKDDCCAQLKLLQDYNYKNNS